MKKIIRTLFAYLLRMLARAALRKYKPTVIMVTGSVGKTSTKDALAAVLSERFFLRASEKSYNSEFGVPLTILGAQNPWAHPTYWIRTFFRSLMLVIFPSHYPSMLVLEVGADRPGDLAKILDIATPDLVVVTRLPDMPVHVEAYATPAAVREEEFAPAYALSPGSPLILSTDDSFAVALAAPLAVRTCTFGTAEKALVRVSNERLSMTDGIPSGMTCIITVEGKHYDLMVPGALGEPQLLAPAAAIATGLTLGMSVEACLKGLKKYSPPPGRGRLLRGMHESVLIDDSYNASPAAVEEGLNSLNLVAESKKGTRRIAVIGDMLELGRYSKEQHEKIGEHAAHKADILVVVGTRARAIAESAITHGMSQDTAHRFDTSEMAAGFMVGLIQKGDAVLIKGSQSIRTERIVEALLADDADRKYLVRQDTEWRKR